MSKWLLCSSLLLVAACGKGLSFSDDEGGHSAASGPDTLSQPYARGAKLRIFVEKVQADWTLRSDSTTVFTIDKVTVDKTTLTAECTASGEGSAKIVLADATGAEKHSATVQVKTADRAVLLAHGPARLLGKMPSSTAMAEVKDARILTGGKAVFMVGYFKGDQRLYGRGLAKTTASTQLVVTNNTSTTGPISEWLFVTALTDGDYSIALNPNDGATIATLGITAVPDSAIASLQLSEEVGYDRTDKNKVWVLAQALDSSGRAIHGVYSTWTLAGTPQVNGGTIAVSGDFFRYLFATGGSPQDVVATHGTITGTLKVQANEGTVTDTTYLGCSVARGRSPSPWGYALLLLLAPLLLLRRRIYPR